MARSAGHVDSYYAATAHPASDHAALAGEVSADVCVIGAGFTGLSAALNLAERGFKVVVLEAERVGWGASGRNGGQICTGFSPSMAKIEGWVGREDAQALWLMAEEGKAIIRERVARHAIDCDLKWGYMHGAVKAAQFDELKAERDHLAERYGYPNLTLLERAGTHEMVATDAYLGALHDTGAGHFHPLNYCLGLARAAVAAGVIIHERSPVIAVETGDPAAARTAAGRVKARFLVLAGNAYLGDLVPAIRAKIMPVGTYIASTVPLGANRAKALIPSDAAVADCNFVLNYFRLSADHRLLFGGMVSYTTLMPPNLAAAMHRRMRKVFPDLADVAFDHVWGGNVAITAERSPHFGRLAPNILFAQGYSGTGVALTGLAGKVIAEAISGTAERFDVFTRLPHTSFPGGKALRAPILALAMTWFRLRDLL